MKKPYFNRMLYKDGDDVYYYSVEIEAAQRATVKKALEMMNSHEHFRMSKSKFKSIIKECWGE